MPEVGQRLARWRDGKYARDLNSCLLTVLARNRPSRAVLAKHLFGRQKAMAITRRRRVLDAGN